MWHKRIYDKGYVRTPHKNKKNGTAFGPATKVKKGNVRTKVDDAAGQGDENLKESKTVHTAVLLDEVLELLDIHNKKTGTFLDATMGGGGHSLAMLEQLAPSGFLLAIDQDDDAIARTRLRLSAYQEQLRIEKRNFSQMFEVATEVGISGFDGILMDLGVSSDQLDTPDRGFSFQKDGPLDMRMDPEAELSAEGWVNDTPAAEMMNVFRAYGEEPRARRYADAIIEARRTKRFTRTLELADLIEKVSGGRRGRTHPATKVFQAIRIRVNRELDVLEDGLEAAISLLKPGGRLVVISFHSLEDRMVKRCFADHEGRDVSLHQGGSRWEGREPRVKRVTRKPLIASSEENARNPRARSAKVRAAERLED